MRTSVEALVLHAERRPMEGVARPGPHQLYRHPRIAIEERDLGPLGPDDVRAEMMFVGICGTDLHAVQGDPDTGYILGSSPLDVTPAGRVLGHEGVGRIVAVGEHVDNIPAGRIASFESIIRCYHCDPCRRGAFNQCERAVLMGMERDGLFSTVADIPSGLAHDVTDLAALDGGLYAATCLEPAACAYVACSLARVNAGASVLVFGAGPIGLFAAMLSRIAFGASAVHVVEPVPFRRRLASQWADRSYDVEEFFADPPAVEVLIEASGAVENVNRALPCLTANGRIALLARGGHPLVLDRVDHLITNNISIVGSRGHLCGAFGDVLRLVRAGRLPLHELVTEVVDGLDGLLGCLKTPNGVIDGNCKVLAKLLDG